MTETKIRMMRPSDLEVATATVGTAHAMLSAFDWKTLLADLYHADAVGPILDPTLYRDWIQHKDRDAKLAMIKAVATFVAAIDDIKKQIEPTDDQ